ncbi:hypothetical protein [Hoeflea olei]|uniref:Uncharacterized protein n=1 Tax=Hoeflea olei TaxID=1480615 RepID=A0A1C1YZM9_9HYPH|nr:hypothetical protein [Hoeflea olei]OCW58932.1 hypothetical protein AWJ14_04225 [Hoeflea olei]
MAGTDMKRASLEELRRMKQSGVLWPAATAASRPDLPEDFWADAVLRLSMKDRQTGAGDCDKE